MIWDASGDRVFRSFPYLLLATADGPGMTYLNGLVGHSGAYGCRLYCPTKGRHKPNKPIYYPAMLLPRNYTIVGCNHGDLDVRNIPPTSIDEYSQNLAYVMHSSNDANFKVWRKETGIAKPSLFSGLPTNRILPIPGCFPADLMHLVSLNLTDLLLSLWRGSIDCDPADSAGTLAGPTVIANSKECLGEKTLVEATPVPLSDTKNTNGKTVMRPTKTKTARSACILLTPAVFSRQITRISSP